MNFSKTETNFFKFIRFKMSSIQILAPEVIFQFYGGFEALHFPSCNRKKLKGSGFFWKQTILENRMYSPV